MREFIRHPSDIPIEITGNPTTIAGGEQLRNISYGGLMVASRVPWPINALVSLRIPCISPSFLARGKVMWCRAGNAGYDIGIAFLEHETLFQLRMIEQICHIEHYKLAMLETEGRQLNGNQAATEWIAKHASDFPQLEDGAA